MDARCGRPPGGPSPQAPPSCVCLSYHRQLLLLEGLPVCLAGEALILRPLPDILSSCLCTCVGVGVSECVSGYGGRGEGVLVLAFVRGDGLVLCSCTCVHVCDVSIASLATLVTLLS